MASDYIDVTRLDDNEIFARIIRAWHRRHLRESVMTQGRIAQLAVGAGGSRESRAVSRVLRERPLYFVDKHQNRFEVNWEMVERDHPHLVSRAPGAPVSQDAAPDLQQATPEAPDPRTAAASVLQALKDEFRAARRASNNRRVESVCCEHEQRAPMGDGHYYRVVYWLKHEDDELHISEGLKVELVWGLSRDRQHDVTGLLLAHDPDEQALIIKIGQRLPDWTRDARGVARPHQAGLVKTLGGAAQTALDDPGSLCWRLADPGREPQLVDNQVTPLIDGLDDSQAAAVRFALGHDVTLLWGPPGTGKTYTLARLIASKVLAGKRVLAASISNVAVDQLALKVAEVLRELAPDAFRDGSALRHGYPVLDEVLKTQDLFPRCEEIKNLREEIRELRQRLNKRRAEPLRRTAEDRDRLRSVEQLLKSLAAKTHEEARVIFATVAGTTTDDYFEDAEFDMVVADEASMMSIVHLAALTRGRVDQVVIAGDFRQLGPVVLAKSEAAARWLERDLFSLAGIVDNREHPALQMLRVQRRMHRDIAELINRPFYHGRLRTKVSADTVRAREVAPYPGRSVVMVELGDDSECHLTPSNSRVNRFSAHVTATLALRARRAAPDHSLAVVTPYRSQVQAIRKALEDLETDEALRRSIRVGTVHAYQGGEADTVIWDLVESRRSDERLAGIGKLFQKDTGNRLCNVAISRARGKLIVVGQRRAFFGAKHQDAVWAPKKIMKALEAHVVDWEADDGAPVRRGRRVFMPS